MSAEQQKQLFEEIGRLDEQLQNHLLEYVHMLANSRKNRERLLSYAGSFSPEDIKAFQEAEQESEKIDENEW